MYKDRNKQKEANRQAQARRRQQGMTKRGMTEGVTGVTLPQVVIEELSPEIHMAINDECNKRAFKSLAMPANFGQDDCTCRHCQNNRAKGSPHTLNHGAHKLAKALSKKELNRVTLPGDVDYKGAA